MTKLAQGDRQRENINEEKNAYEILNKHIEELELMEKFLIGFESK